MCEFIETIYFFRKIQSNPFLVIEKVILIFQNFQDYMIDFYLQTK